MKILHLGDLHFGKRINNLSLEEDQRFINEEIYKVIEEEKIETVIIAGDVYDRSIPSEEAVALLDEFLSKLHRMKMKILLIAGNHDSAERLSFGNSLMEASDTYISSVYEGEVKKVVLKDEYGPLNFYLMPFVKPAHVRKWFPEEEIETYTDALKVAIDNMHIDDKERNIILSHQFVSGANKDGSEDELFVGGLCNVDPEVYEVFDYTALGHIHRPQNVKNNVIRYCGSPMKFSFNEEKQNKALTVLEIKGKGDIEIKEIPLKPLRDFVTVKGSFEQLLKGHEGVREDDFVSVVLTDEEDIPNAFSVLSATYKNIQTLSYDNTRTRNSSTVDGASINTELNPGQLIDEFFEKRNGKKMSLEQSEYINKLIEEIWKGQA